MSPSCYSFISIQLDFLPFQSTRVSCFNKTAEVQFEEIFQAAVLNFTASKNIDRILDNARRMKTARFWLNTALGHFYLLPRKRFHIVGPEVSQIFKAFSPENDQIWKFELSCMVSSLPGRGLIFKRRKLNPVKIGQIKDTD